MHDLTRLQNLAAAEKDCAGRLKLASWNFHRLPLRASHKNFSFPTFLE